MPDKIIVTTHLSKEEKRFLEEIANAKSTSVSEILREAISDFCQKQKKKSSKKVPSPKN